MKLKSTLDELSTTPRNHRDLHLQDVIWGSTEREMDSGSAEEYPLKDENKKQGRKWRANWSQ